MPKKTTESSSTPNHIGFIVDGNRRWARDQGKGTEYGHRKGGENLRNIAEACFDTGVYAVSAYVFSTENWKRSKREVSYLMDLLVEKIEQYAEDFVERGVRIVQLGSKEHLSKKVLAAIERVEAKTAHNSDHLLGFCFNYGGQLEITDAVKSIIESGVGPEEVTEDLIRDNLYHPDFPDLDYVIRTSGEHRLSNFMLWRAAYAELYFPKVHWPDFKKDELDKALVEFANRQRRFGA